MGGGRSLSPAESERLRDALRELVSRYGTQKDVAAKVGVTQQAISTVLGKNSAGSYALARKVAQALGRPVEVVLGAHAVAGAMLWRDLPSTAAALDQARAQFPGVSAAAWEWVEGLAGSPPPCAAPVFFWTLATAYANAPREPVAPTVAREGSGVRQRGRK